MILTLSIVELERRISNALLISVQSLPVGRRVLDSYLVLLNAGELLIPKFKRRSIYGTLGKICLVRLHFAQSLAEQNFFSNDRLRHT